MSITVDLKDSKVESTDFNDIPNNYTFTGVYDGRYGLYHKHFSQLIRISDDDISMVTDDTRQMGKVAIMEVREADVTVTVKQKSSRGRPRKKS